MEKEEEEFKGVSGIDIKEIIKPSEKVKVESMRKPPEVIQKFPFYKYVNDAYLVVDMILNHLNTQTGDLRNLYNMAFECQQKKWITEENNFLYQIINKEEIMLKYNTEIIVELKNCVDGLVKYVEDLHEEIKKIKETIPEERKKQIIEMILYNFLVQLGATRENKERDDGQKGMRLEKAEIFFDKRFFSAELIKNVLDNSLKFVRILDQYYAKEKY